MTLLDKHSMRLNPRWNRIQVGGGHLVVQPEGVRLLTINAQRGHYADAQIDDYAGRPRRAFPWRAPTTLHVMARASTAIRGTAGFGWWNNPFSPFGGIPALPAAAWFLYASPPSNMPLADGVPGHGWKCAVIDATTLRALRWAMLAPAVLLANHVHGLRRRMWPRVQRDLAIAEAPLAVESDWRCYSIEWHNGNVRFLVDGMICLEAPFAPRGPLGFVAWIDNQYAIATPQGRFGWGLLDAPGAQWLDLKQLHTQ